MVDEPTRPSHQVNPNYHQTTTSCNETQPLSLAQTQPLSPIVQDSIQDNHNPPDYPPAKDKHIEYPKHYCNRDIFNPIRKRRDQNKLQNNMKYDYRGEGTSPTDGAASRNMSRHALDWKKAYLFTYNIFMFVLFLMVHLILLIKIVGGRIDDDTVRGAASIVKFLTYTQLLETVHPMLKLVPGGPLMPFMQVLGRIVVNIFLTDPKIRLQSAPFVSYLFVVWSCIEVFRYSYYALKVFKVEIYPLTWCRYTLFMPLYPCGGFCESQVILTTVKEYAKTGRYSVGLPNSANISFHLPTFLNFYTFILLGPSIMYLMSYMWAQRCKQLKKEKTA